MPLPASAARARIPLTIAALLLLSAGLAQAQTDQDVDDAVMELGREVFLEIAQPPCGICHVLADAEATGTIAPSLDDLQPTVDEVREAVRSGPGVMPDYAQTLSEEEIEAVSQYVAAVAGGN